MKKLLLVFFLVFTLIVKAQNEGKSAFSVNADVVNTYVWRGSYLAGTSVQPSMDFRNGGFSLGAWGSVDIAGFGYKEVDLFASYSFKKLTVSLFDYWVAGEMSYNYFDFSKKTIHLLDVGLTYTFDRIPLSIGWYTIIWGDETFTKQWENGASKKAFPTYIEVTRFFQVKEINLEATIGISPWHSSAMYNRYNEGGRTDGFAVINLSLKASKNLKITDHYSLPVFSQLIYNPAKEDSFLVFGIKF